jgi:GDPmannose 4,6-dehydratase
MLAFAPKTQRWGGHIQEEDRVAPKTALITGITGQDGSYLAELLLGKGYVVHGMIRRTSTFTTDRIDHLYTDPHEAATRLHLHFGDLTDGSSIRRIIETADPDEVYHLGAQSHVRVSFDQPLYTGDVDALGSLRVFDAAREYSARSGRALRIYNACSSEMFGSAPPPQTETTRFHPRSPYGASKVAAYAYAVNYREAYGLHVTNGILFNHESPRRGETFVTRKVTRAVGRIMVGLQKTLFLGNLEAKRDWGFAGDYVEAMWRMVQQDESDDFVVATGESHSVREMLDIAFGGVDLDWQEYVRFDERYLRPTEVDHLEGDASKAEASLGWKPETTFAALMEMMVQSDLELARRELLLVESGYPIPNQAISSRHD